MKNLVLLLVILISAPSFANCKAEAIEISDHAVELFRLSDRDINCAAVGHIEKFESLPVVAVMPRRYAYRVSYVFPCGPHPKKPEVNLLLNDNCKIVDLKMSGHLLLRR